MVKWLALGVVVLLGVGLAAFEPWRLFTHSSVDEPLPGASDVAVVEAPSTPSPGEPTRRSGRAASPSPSPEPELVELAAGDFVDAEHDTGGTARVLRLADGTRYVRLEDFSTSDGPDVFVGLSDAPSGGTWGSYDDGRYVQLGGLKATDGNQNYEIPADVDLAGLTTVVIWCARFDVAFGTADVGDLAA